ncbi:hypothetical protein [Chengkuizengella sediminis]|uniref:hypothetical protein n=1 Tax=Chengkuizengella sediminis TaxID=1885917 RepID=UPI001389AF52|nr:hypothetical protein [Chengkuizengella sediminis]NDI35774.1 hypothetical protein [Chengkuizengella sediminis]
MNFNFHTNETMFNKCLEIVRIMIQDFAANQQSTSNCRSVDKYFNFDGRIRKRT